MTSFPFRVLGLCLFFFLLMALAWSPGSSLGAAEISQAADGAHAKALPSPWSVIPFVLLLLAIVFGPLFVPRWWHRFYPLVAIGLGLVTAIYYTGVLGDSTLLIHVGFEYVSFISLIAGLYLCTGGIVLGGRLGGSPLRNTALLIGGAALANIIGTTGASMILIQPFIRANRGRLKPFHIVFFIFLVANIGGALTPIGDPPLLLGYLRGISFFRFFALNIMPWLVAVAVLSVIFYVCDRRVPTVPVAVAPPRPLLSGWGNLTLLACVVAAIFLDPSRLTWLPAIEIHGHRFSFVREFVLLGLGVTALRISSPVNLRMNAFSFAPIREVAILFVGIFMTMLPALELIRHQAVCGSLFGIPLTPPVLYAGTGICSAILDNAPTFVAFLAGMEGEFGMDAAAIGVSDDPIISKSLSACAVASVFWGAMTYIGNGPNFMVKAIAEQATDEHGQPLVKMPGFHEYVLFYSVPILLPVLIMLGVLFFR